MAKPWVTVRMYQGLLGDCFLIRLFAEKPAAGRAAPAAANILIDCGILQAVPEADKRLRRMADDIKTATGGRLDLLVVTHEHYDHVSGFGLARDLFLDGGLAIDQLWLAWTEDDADDQARTLRGMFVQSRQAVAAGVQRICAAAGDAEDVTFEGDAAGLEGFIGPSADALAAKGGLTVAGILDALKARLKPPPDNYLKPGDVRDTPGVASLRAYVLGPPRDEAFLFKDRPSGNPDKRETYLDGRAAEARDIARNFRQGSGAVGLDGMPFGERHQRLPDKWVLGDLAAPADPSADLAKLATIRDEYVKQDAAWQRIDTAWQGVIGQLAIKLDSDTNNSSLVLAFELAPGEGVMLFAADAQVGNWLSWHEQTWPAPAGDPAKRITAEDLLGRTTLYKVGHHGSHNATLRAKGLEMMTSGALTAMIPVVEEVAEKRRWKMPFGDLYAALQRQTNGRILRGDRPPDPAVLDAQPNFKARVRQDPQPDPTLGPAWIEFDVA